MKISFDQIKQALDRKGFAVIKKNELAELTEDYKLFEYSSYEEYRSTQIEHNKRKLDWVWADETVLSAVSDRVEEEFLGYKNHDIYGVCHGARNGFEVEFLKNKFNRVFGTDISETCEQYPSMIQWDFHDQNPDWVDKFQFIYTNSLDQS